MIEKIEAADVADLLRIANIRTAHVEFTNGVVVTINSKVQNDD